MNANANVKKELNLVLDEFSRQASLHSAQGIINLFAKDSDIVMLGSEKGESAMSRREFKGFLDRIFSKPVTYSWTWKRKVISMQGPVAWLTAEGSVTITSERDSPKKKTTPYRLTAVFEKRGVRWLLMHYHGSEPV